MSRTSLFQFLILAFFLPIAFSQLRNVPPECGGDPATHYGLPCQNDTTCGTRGKCVRSPMIKTCSCYECERSPKGCCPEQKANCAITPGKMWTQCKMDDDCVKGNKCWQVYQPLCMCPFARPPVPPPSAQANPVPTDQKADVQESNDQNLDGQKGENQDVDDQENDEQESVEDEE